jgi:hypothetical protein
MNRIFAVLLLITTIVTAYAADPYIGFVYPAGGRRGTTFRVTIGGQFIEKTTQVDFSGEGLTAEIVEYNRKIGPQVYRLLREQRQEILFVAEQNRSAEQNRVLEKLTRIITGYVQQPACDSIANILICDVTIAPDAACGERDIRLVAGRGLTNPMSFFVDQLPEYTAPPLSTCPKPILGKEEQALRKRQLPRDRGTEKKADFEMMSSPAMMGEKVGTEEMNMGESGELSETDDPVVRIRQPCVVNGQIAPGTVDRYLVKCYPGQELVVDVKARVLVPYLADAVPGWFQPVVKLCDSSGAAVAYNDDYMFKPDPVLIYRIRKNGDYLLSIYDSIYRGREDFVYRMRIGPLPFVTSRFPLGGQIGQPARVEIQGVNLIQNHVIPSTHANGADTVELVSVGKNKVFSNVFPFALDSLPDAFEAEPNNSGDDAQLLRLPIIMNGCIDTPSDRDLYRFEAKRGATVVAEVKARRLDSPLDSTVMILAPSGLCVGYNDDYEDAGSGLNTHHADSWLSVTLPEDGIYTCVISDAQHRGGAAYAYRLRLSAPRPDFEILLVPSHVEFSGAKSSDNIEAHLIRRDGFAAPVKLFLKEPQKFTLEAKPFGATQNVTRVTIRTGLKELSEPVALKIEGEAQIDGKTIRREAQGAEDRMQAFLWRHLVPSREMCAWIKKRSEGKNDRKKGKVERKGK